MAERKIDQNQIADLKANSMFGLVGLTNQNDGDVVFLSGFYSDADGGGGEFYWDSDRAKSTANGGTIVDPDAAGTLSATALGDFLSQQGTGSGSGCWVRIFTPNEYHAEWFGVNASNSASENGTAYDGISSALSDVTGTLVLVAATTSIDRTFDVPNNLSLKGAGMDTSIIDASGSEGTFTDAVVLVKGSNPTQISDLASNVSKGGISLTFSSAHGLSVGDVGLILNPTDSSYSGFRANYRAGEYFRVREVVSTTEVKIDHELYAGYTAANVEVYHMATPASGSYEGFTAVAPGASTSNGAIRAIQFKFGERLKINGVGATNSDNASMSIARCFDVQASNLFCEQITEDPGSGTQYGLVIGNSQNIYAQGDFVGARHGTSVGGGDDFAVVNRQIHIHDSKIENSEQNNSLYAADWHGNTEWSSYTNCHTNYGGFNIAGNHNEISNCSARGTKVVILGSEITGCDHVIDGVQIYASGDALDVSRGLIDIGGNTDAFSSDTDEGGTFVLRNIRVDAPALTGNIINVRNRGFTGDNWNVVVDGVQGVVGAPAASNNATVSELKVSGDDCNRLQATNINIENRKPVNKNSAQSVRQDPQTGTVSWTTTTGSNLQDEAITFNDEFSVTPVIVLSPNSANTTGGGRVLGCPLLPASDGFTARLTTPDAANFSGANTIEGSWIAQVWEW